jgi:hypothetical protein
MYTIQEVVKFFLIINLWPGQYIWFYIFIAYTFGKKLEGDMAQLHHCKVYQEQ